MDPETTWHKTKKEIHKKKVYVQYHCPIEYNISNSYCHKKHHSDAWGWSYLEQNGAANELTQIKTPVEQYYVYNIFSLQNITL